MFFCDNGERKQRGAGTIYWLGNGISGNRSKTAVAKYALLQGRRVPKPVHSGTDNELQSLAQIFQYREHSMDGRLMAYIVMEMGFCIAINDNMWTDCVR